jgi:curved DNA-binding protein CbpA
MLPPASAERPWREVMGLHREPGVTAEMMERRYRDLARERHPDVHGGNSAMMAELNAARDAARRELGA